MEKKKIVFLTRTLSVGGVATSLIELIKTLNFNNYDIFILTEFEQYDLKYKIDPRIKIDCYCKCTNLLVEKILKFRDKIYSKKYLFFLWKILNQIEKKYKLHKTKEYFKKIKYDIGIAYHQGFASTILIKYVQCKKRLLWYHSSTLMPDCKKSIFKRADKIVCCTPGLGEKIFRKWNIDSCKIVDVPCLLDYKALLELSNEKIDSLPINKNDLVFLTVSRLTEDKGLMLGYEVFKKLISFNKHYKWLIVGGGPLYFEMKKIIEKDSLQNNILLVGEKLNPYPYYKCSNFYFSPSYFECFGVTLAESKIFSLPIISGNTNAGIYHIENNKFGIVCEMNVDSFLSNIFKFLSNKDLLNSINNAYKCYDYNLFYAKGVEKFLKLID